MARKKSGYKSELERIRSFEHCPAVVYKQINKMSNEDYEAKFQEWRMPYQYNLTTK